MKKLKEKEKINKYKVEKKFMEYLKRNAMFTIFLQQILCGRLLRVVIGKVEK